MEEFETSSLFTVLPVDDVTSSTQRKFWGLPQNCSVSQGACGKSNRKPMFLAGSRLVLQIAPKNGGRTGFETHLDFWSKIAGLDELFALHCALHLWLLRQCHRSIRDGTELECVTGRVRQVEPEIHVPCRLSVGAQNCTKNGGRTDLKHTICMFLVENG